MFRIFKTKEFETDLEKLDNSEKIVVNKILKQLKEIGDSVGKPLSGLSFFKEKKIKGKRIYFLVYKSWGTILLLAISDKKAQNATINAILLNIAEYQEYTYETLKNMKLL